MKGWLLALLLLLQDADLDRLIQQLGDNSSVRRDEAVRKLREIGPRAQEALEKARRDADPERRDRASLLLQEFERERAQAFLESKERLKTFPRITADLDAPLGVALKELARQSGWAWDLDDLPLDRNVVLKGKDIPMIEALERIGFARRYAVLGEVHLEERKPTAPGVYVDGVRLSFSRRTWSPRGVPVGTIFETNLEYAFDGDVRWTVAGIKTERDLALENCAIHSPRLVYVASADLADPRVTVKGTRLWFCPTPIEFKEPKDGVSWRSGTSQVSIEWPFVRVRVDAALEEHLLKKTLSEKDIQVKVKPGREKESMGGGVGGGGGGRFGGRFGGKNLAWCGCVNQPATERPSPPPMAKERSVKIGSSDLYVLDDLESISITFHKPVDDAFEVVSPPLK